MSTTQEFMLFFRMKPMLTKPSTEEIERMQQTWGAYLGGLASQQKLVSTTRIGFQGKQILANGQVIEGMLLSNELTLSGTLIVKAKDFSEAEEIAKQSPVLTDGGSVEIRTTIPM